MTILLPREFPKLSLAQMFRRAILDEEEAITSYGQYAARAWETRDGSTARMYEKLADQEKEHKAILQKRMNDLNLY